MSLPAANPQPDTPEARRYNRIKRLLELADLALSVGFLVVLLATGWTNRLRDISEAVQAHVEAAGFSVIRQFVGHGIGRQMHEDPQLPNFVTPNPGPPLCRRPSLRGARRSRRTKPIRPRRASRSPDKVSGKVRGSAEEGRDPSRP